MTSQDSQVEWWVTYADNESSKNYTHKFGLFRLQKVFRESPTEGPQAKKVKFSNIQEELGKQFPDHVVSQYAVSKSIAKAFPRAISKRSGKSRKVHVFGMESARESFTSEEQSTSLQQSASVDPSTSVHQSSLVDSLREENEQLRQRIQQLQSQLERSRPCTLSHQMDLVVQHAKHAVHGPDTLEHFRDFSIDAIVAELHEHAPDLYQLFIQLANTSRSITTESDHRSVEELKAVASFSCLLNARNRRAKGIQLLISLMLIARATSRQVRYV